MAGYLAPVAKAVASAAPAVIEQVKKRAPQAYQSSKRWIARKMGTASVDIEKMASDPVHAPVVMEALARNNVSVRSMYNMAPSLSQAELRDFMRGLAALQVSVREHGDDIAGGLTPKDDSVKAALIMKHVNTNVKRAASALGATTVEELRLRLDAIRAIDADDLKSVETSYGQRISNIPL